MAVAPIVKTQSLTGVGTTLTDKITIRRESKLSACHFSIIGPPVVITHCAPLTVIAHLHPAFLRCCSTSKSQISISAVFFFSCVFCASILNKMSHSLHTTLCCTWTMNTSILRVVAIGSGIAAVGQMSL